MAEPTPATTPATESAPRENFDEMSIEDLKKIVDAPLERVNAPNKNEMEASLKAIDNQIAKLRARFDEIKAEKQMIRDGFKIEMAARKENSEARKALFDSRAALTAKRTETRNEFNKIREELNAVRDQIKDASRMKPELIEEKIKKGEEKIERESLPIAEEKALNRQISQWRKDLQQAMATSGLFERRDALEEQFKASKASLDAINKELDAVYEKLGVVKEAAPKKEEGEKKEDPFKKLDEEWEENKKKIDEKYQEKKAILNDFKEKTKVFRDFSFANRRRKAAQFALERKERELEEAELIKKEEEEALKRHPFEKEMAICDTLVSYLKGLEAKETKTAAKAAKEVVVPEGMTVLKREEEDYFAVEPKKSKKGKRAEKKASNLIHNFNTLESFATVRVAVPKTIEEVKASLEAVVARKEFFNTLPRGANVDEEIAKLN